MKYKVKEIMSIMNMPDSFDYVKIKGFLNNGLVTRLISYRVELWNDQHY